MSSGNPFLNRIEKRAKNHHGDKSEKRLGKKLQATLHAGSGALSRKADFSHAGYLHEAKATVRGSMGIRYEWLTKITAQATFTGQTPVVNISFTRDNGSALPQGDWIMMPLSTFQELIAE